MNTNSLNANENQVPFLKKHGFDVILFASLVLLTILRITSVINYEMAIMLAGILFIIWFIYSYKLAPQIGRSFSKKALYFCIVLEIILIITQSL